MAKRKKRKLGQNEGRGKGVFLALGVGGAILVVGVVLAIFAFKKDPKPPNQQAQVSDENKTSESDDNGSLLSENTPGALTNLAVNPVTSPSINLDLPVGKRMVWTFGTGKMDIQRIYMGKTTNTLTQVFGKPDSIINTDENKAKVKFVVFKYDQMKVLEGTNRYSTVRFTLRQEAKGEAKVMAVTPDPRSVVANPLNPSFAVTAGLVAYYPFNGNAKDESGNGNHGLVKGATLTMDRNRKPATAYRFVKDSLITVDISKWKVNVSSTHTISAWARYDSFSSAYNHLINIGSRSVSFQQILSAGDNPKTITLGAGKSSSQPWTQVNTAGPSIGRWYHYVIVYKEGVSTLYVDGLHVGNSGKLIGSFEHPNFLWLGGHAGKKNDHYGQLDDVRFYNRALSAGEVKALHDLEKPKGK
jgi:hypothetical protein